MILVWEKTGDSLEIKVDNHQLVEYWVSELDRTDKKTFDFVSSTLPDDSVTTQLADCLESSNQILERFGIEPLMDSKLDWFNQDNLNVLHSRWVKVINQHPKLCEVLHKIADKSIEQKFHDVNILIHKIEFKSLVEYTNSKDVTWQAKNIFGSEISKFGQWQIELHYQNLGRSTYEKWYNYDCNIDDSDTNNFTHIGGLVYFNLCRPITLQPPVEYINYCAENNIIPYGNKLPIGNFVEDITTLRHVFKRNVNTENNRISFKI